MTISEAPGITFALNKLFLSDSLLFCFSSYNDSRDRHSRDGMVVGFQTTYARDHRVRDH